MGKCFKKYQRQKKNEKTARHPKNTWRLQRCKEHPRNQICKKRSVHHQDKEWERRNHHVSKRDCPCLWGTLQKSFTTTMNKNKLNKKSVRMKMRAASMCITTTPKWDDENPRDHDRRVANCNQQTQKKANPQTATESEQKTSKHAMMRREKWWDKSSTKS